MDGDQIQSVGNASNTPTRLVTYLSIVAGMHAGARLSLGDTPICVIGSAPHCDVILRDPSIAAEHLTVISRSNGAVVRALGGPFMVDGRVFAQGDALAVSDGMSLDLGEAKLVLSLGPRGNTGDVDMGLGSRKQGEAGARANLGEESSVQHAARTEPRKSTRTAIIALVSTGVLFVTAALAIGAMDNLRPSTKSNVALLEQSIVSPQLAGVIVKERDGTIHLSGFVATAADRQLLQDRVAPHAANMKIENNVEMGADVASRVKESFRINGISATAQYVQHGKIVAEVKAVDVPNATAAKDNVLKDIRTLRGIEVIAIKGSEPLPETPPCINPSTNREALRLQYVVSDAPAYMKTADGTKYYVEGQLPTGHAIKRITDEQVFLDCGGVASVVTF